MGIGFGEILFMFPLLLIGMALPIVLLVLLFMIYNKLNQIERNTRRDK